MERVRRRVEEEEAFKELAEAAEAFMQDIRNREEERRLTSAVL